MGEPTVKPLASAATAEIDTGTADAAAPVLAALVSGACLQAANANPANKKAMKS